ncbi:MAG: YihA family ribosome biogenesis GTP-binding protein [Clostridia bacterium]|nr:YihA family ribosome biogenesis GTP-binding protein [Clostridia bacterium]
MKTIKSAQFIKSETDFSNYKGFDLPEIMLAGRSNVGKSSFINMLSNNTKLAKVSATQGKTKVVNFFLMNKEFVLVDLPGYGYAETSKVEQHRWGEIIDSYIESSRNLVCAVLLVDVRHLPTEQDKQMLNYFTFNNIPVTIVATKYDKIKKAERMKKISDIAKELKVGVENIYLISSETAYGKDIIVDRLYQFVDGE